MLLSVRPKGKKGKSIAEDQAEWQINIRISGKRKWPLKVAGQTFPTLYASSALDPALYAP